MWTLSILFASSALAGPMLTVFQDGSPPLEDEAVAKALDKQGIRDARLIPLADLYSTVDEADRGTIRSLVSETSGVDTMSMPEEDWAQKALALRDALEKMVPAPGEADTKLMFSAYAELGRMADNANNATPPFFLKIGGEVANVYWYQAGALAHMDPSLMFGLGDDVKPTIDYYKKQIDSGKIGKATASFADANVFSKQRFALKYRVYVDGLEMLIEDPKGQVEMPLGTHFVHIADKTGPVLQRRIDARDVGEVRVFATTPTRGDLLASLEGVKKCEPLKLDSGADEKLGAWAKRNGTDKVHLLFVDPVKMHKSIVVQWTSGNLTKVDCLE